MICRDDRGRSLVRQVLAAVPTLPQLPLSSIDPAEPDAELMDVLAEEERLLPRILPVGTTWR